jgi:hypothetical protein
MTMSTLRFSLIAIAVFTLAFVGISWASKGFPVMVMRTVPLKPDARLPTFEESRKQGERKDWENSKTAQSDGNKERDALRLELMQASTGYKLSPCDATMKKNLVEALTRYVSAWSAMSGCKSGICNGSDKQRDDAVAAFNTPADIRVHEALRDALNKGGIGKDDFPRTIRTHVFIFSGMPFPYEGDACPATGRRAETAR